MARVGSQDLRRRLHLGQVDHQELLEIVLAHFGHGEQPEASVFSYGRQGQPAQLIFKMGRLGHIADVTPGPGFMKRDIDEVAAKIRHTLLGEQPVRVGRVIAFSTEPVRGVFRYRDRFQMLPMPSGAPAPREGLIADQPFVLEVSYASCPEDWIGFSRQAKAVMMHTRLLAVLSNQHVWHSNQARFDWALVTEEGQPPTSRWTQLGYHFGLPASPPRFTDAADVQAIERVPFQAYYSEGRGVSNAPLRLPDNLEESLDRAFALGPQQWDRFFRAVSWYCQFHNLFLASRSAAFVALVSALESLMVEEERCDACGQTRSEAFESCPACGQTMYRLTRRFREFLERYSPTIDLFPREKRLIYATRSGFVHGLEMAPPDLSPWGLDSRSQDHYLLERNLSLIARVAIYNWLQGTPVSPDATV